MGGQSPLGSAFHVDLPIDFYAYDSFRCTDVFLHYCLYEGRAKKTKQNRTKQNQTPPYLGYTIEFKNIGLTDLNPVLI